MLPLFGLSLIFSIVMCVHVVRTNQAMYWLMIILMLQPLGGVVYLIAIVLPELSGGPTARRIQRTARETLDPGREYREAKIAWHDQHDEAWQTPRVFGNAELAGQIGRQ